MEFVLHIVLIDTSGITSLVVCGNDVKTLVNTTTTRRINQHSDPGIRVLLLETVESLAVQQSGRVLLDDELLIHLQLQGVSLEIDVLIGRDIELDSLEVRVLEGLVDRHNRFKASLECFPGKTTTEVGRQVESMVQESLNQFRVWIPVTVLFPVLGHKDTKFHKRTFLLDGNQIFHIGSGIQSGEGDVFKLHYFQI